MGVQPAAAVTPATIDAKPAVEAPTAEPGQPDAPAAEQATNPTLLAKAFADVPAPERFTVKLEATVGDLTIDVRRSWAPLGADRFYSLVRAGYYDGNAFFRVVEGFVAQLGLHGDPAVNRLFLPRTIADDPVRQSNVAGMVAFAASGKGTRTTQVFIDLEDNPQLDKLGFAPFGRVREIDTARKVYAGYGEGAPGGRGPVQARIQREGKHYLTSVFPRLDTLRRASVTDEKRVR